VTSSSTGGEEPTGLLVMAYGTPSGPEHVDAYYTHIRRGRPPTPELLAQLRARYEAIGGVSPLLEITRAQVRAITAELAGAGRGDLVVALGMKHAPPFIEDGVSALLDAGVSRIIGVVLAPHYSTMSVGEYEQRVVEATRAASEPPVVVSVVHSWHLADDYIRLLVREVNAALLSLTPEARARAEVLFTAHSLPQRILSQGDPYPDQLRETAAAVAGEAELERWGIAWQSAGRTAEAWIGPDVLESIEQLAAAGTPAVVVCPCGFVADHLEVLYDLDIEARGHARGLGLEFARTASPNDAPELARAVAGAVLEQLKVPAA
jgi:protoporphyrin/coproporphyrin ferrochelatase